jgi:hypothetical protein
VFVAECESVLYEFDPLERALKDCGFSEWTEENNRQIAARRLEHQKTGSTRARTGARFRWAKQTMQPEEFSAYLATWREEILTGVDEAWKVSLEDK